MVFVYHGSPKTNTNNSHVFVVAISHFIIFSYENRARIKQRQLKQSDTRTSVILQKTVFFQSKFTQLYGSDMWNNFFEYLVANDFNTIHFVGAHLTVVFVISFNCLFNINSLKIPKNRTVRYQKCDFMSDNCKNVQQYLIQYLCEIDQNKYIDGCYLEVKRIDQYIRIDACSE